MPLSKQNNADNEKKVNLQMTLLLSLQTIETVLSNIIDTRTVTLH